MDENLHMSKPVRMADIAQQLHISTVTVSKALAGKDGVSESLRLKIQQTAEQMGYQRKIIQAERHARYTIGIVAERDYIEQSQSFGWMIYKGLLAVLTKMRHIGVLETVSAPDMKQHTMPLHIQNHQLDGIVTLGNFPLSYRKQLIETGLPIVAGDAMNAGLPQDTVLSDAYYGIYTMTNYVIQQGHQNIMFVGTPQWSSSLSDRYYGFCRAMLEAGISVTKKHLLMAQDIQGKCTLSLDLLSELPTAFICCCDSVAYQLLRLLKERHLRVPEDVSITGFEDYILSSLCTPPITTYSVHVPQLAEACIQLLLERIQAPNRPPQHIVISGSIILRDSVRKLIPTERQAEYR